MQKRIAALREYLAMACAMAVSAICSAQMDEASRMAHLQFNGLQEDINRHLEGIENELSASQPAPALARNWHIAVLAGGAMFTVGLILGAVLGMPGALS